MDYLSNHLTIDSKALEKMQNLIKKVKEEIRFNPVWSKVLYPEILNVDHDNTRAGSLYKKLGFSEFKNDGKTIVMCKQLD